MGASGTTTITFGALPGSLDTSVVVTGQTGILAASLCEAWLDPTQPATADHSVDEHLMASEMIEVSCSNIVAGTGFTINVHANGLPYPFLYGVFNISWVWA